MMVADRADGGRVVGRTLKSLKSTFAGFEPGAHVETRMGSRNRVHLENPKIAK
jgi:hypothetical protein